MVDALYNHPVDIGIIQGYSCTFCMKGEITYLYARSKVVIVYSDGCLTKFNSGSYHRVDSSFRLSTTVDTVAVEADGIMSHPEFLETLSSR